MQGLDRVGLRLGPREKWAKYLVRVVVLGGIVALLLLSGIAVGERIHPSPRPAPVATNATTDTAEQTFAASFAALYLSYGNQERWAKSLRPYLANGVDTGTWWGGAGSQTVSQVLPVSTASLQPGLDRVTVSALVDGGWVYLAVPVHAQGGRFCVVGEPAMVSPPPLASWSPPDSNADVDAGLSVQLRGDLATFFTAYAASDATQLGYLTTPGSNLRGLQGRVSLGGVTSLSVYNGGAQRQALATITWMLGSAQLEQTYRLTLVQSGGKWLVAAVDVGGGA